MLYTEDVGGSNPSSPIQVGLRFLVHCLEDMHQSCPVGDNKDKGGNDTQVRFYDRGTIMHRLWDSDLIGRVSQSEDVWLKDLAALDTQKSREAAAKGTPEDWAMKACWRQERPTKCQRRASDSSLVRSLVMPT
jgi:hypothetical protein